MNGNLSYIFPETQDFLHNGYGSSDMDQISKLLKALEANAGQSTDISTYTSFTALQPQSLENTLALLTFTDQHCTLWRDIPKGTASSTLEEYSVESGYGQNGGWVQQMETPLEADPQAQRKYGLVKYLRQQWKFSDVSGLVAAIEPAETFAKQAATMRLLRQINRSLYTGNSLLVPDEIDGFESAIRANGSSAHVIDLRGALPTQETFDNAAQLIIENFGNPNANMYVSPAGMNTIAQIMKNNGATTSQRILQGTVGNDGGISLGFNVKSIHTAFGTITPKVDLFIGSEYESKTVPKVPNPSAPQTLVEGPTSERAPLIPGVAVTAVTSQPGSLWLSTGVRPSGVVYRYRVNSKNRFGSSQACAVVTPGGAVATAGAYNVAITPNPNSLYAATCFEVYSEASNASGVYLYVGSIAANALAVVTFQDLNIRIPGTTAMFLLDLTSSGDRRTMMLKRLAPLFSQEFSKIGMYRWGVVNLYCTPQYYAPLRFVLVYNVPVGLRTTSPLLLV